MDCFTFSSDIMRDNNIGRLIAKPLAKVVQSNWGKSNMADPSGEYKDLCILSISFNYQCQPGSSIRAGLLSCKALMVWCPYCYGASCATESCSETENA